MKLGVVVTLILQLLLTLGLAVLLGSEVAARGVAEARVRGLEAYVESFNRTKWGWVEPAFKCRKKVKSD